MASKKGAKTKKIVSAKDLPPKAARDVKGGQAADPDGGGEVTKRLTR